MDKVSKKISLVLDDDDMWKWSVLEYDDETKEWYTKENGADVDYILACQSAYWALMRE